MSNILILHGPSQYEIRKAYSLIHHLEGKVPHKLLALAEMSVEINNTPVDLLSFFANPLSGSGLLSAIPSKNGNGTISFESFVLELINLCDKVIILPCEQITYLNNFVFVIGYALGKSKIAGSLYYPGFELPVWYKMRIPNTTDKMSDLQRILESI